MLVSVDTNNGTRFSIQSTTGGEDEVRLLSPDGLVLCHIAWNAEGKLTFKVNNDLLDIQQMIRENTPDDQRLYALTFRIKSC